MRLQQKRESCGPYRASKAKESAETVTCGIRYVFGDERRMADTVEPWNGAPHDDDDCRDDPSPFR